MVKDTDQTIISRRKLILGASGVVGASVCESVLGAPTPPNTSDILIGQSAVFSGPSAALGTEMRQGIQAAFSKINAAGGIDGRKLVLTSLDDSYEPTRASANTQALIEKNCFALLGYVGTPTTVACLPAINAARIPLVGPFTGARALRSPMNPYVFNVRASYDDEGEPIVRQLTAAKGTKTKIGIVYQDDGYGLAVRDAAQAALSKLGMSFAIQTTIKRNSLEVAAAADAILNAQVDSVILGSTYAASALLMNAVHAKKAYPQFGSVSFVGTSGLVDNYPEAAQGLAIAQVMPSPTAISLPIVREYQSAMRAEGINKMTYGAIEGYIAAQVLVAGIKKCGPGATRGQLVKALETLNLDLGGFKVAFSPETRQGSSFTEMTVIGLDGRISR